MRPLFTLRALLPLRSLFTLKTRFALRPRFTLRPLFALRTLLTLRSRLTLRANQVCNCDQRVPGFFLRISPLYFFTRISQLDFPAIFHNECDTAEDAFA